ncbi:MAG: S9 family peptidase, partial [Pyrinomonadaceae bacterium]
MKKFFFLFVMFVFTLSVGAQNYTIQQYLNIRSASSPTLAPDGKRLFYLTNVTGTSQIWMIDLPSGTPQRITNYDDNISFVKFSPKGDGVIFGKAKGGDENTQFFWMNADGSGIRQLTANPQTRYNFGDWSSDGARIYYSSNKRDKNFFDIYSMDITSGKENLIFQQDGNNSFAAASKDGKHIIISQNGTELSLDNNLYLIDTATKTETLLTKHKGAARFADVHFFDDGKITILSSNQNSEFMELAQVGITKIQYSNPSKATYQVMPFIKTTAWDVENIEVSPRCDGLAYVINREGFSELHLQKIEIETKDKPLITNSNFKTGMIMLPAQGVVSGLTFSGDGSKLAFTFSSAKYNPDIWIYDLESKRLTQITKSSLSDIPQTSFVAPELIKYKTFDGREIPAWFYKPRQLVSIVGNIAMTAPLPVIVSVHGGPEGQERPGFNALYQYYLSRGYAILATNVRGSTGYGKTYTHLDDVRKREDSVKDLAYAAEWLKTSGGADAKRIAVMGGSYGGYMTLAAITLYPDLFAAAVDT